MIPGYSLKHRDILGWVREYFLVRFILMQEKKIKV